MAERLAELENEVEIFRRNSSEIVEICSKMVRKLIDLVDFDSYLEEYAIAFRYVTSCATSFSEFNCRLETLRLGTDSTPSQLRIGESEKSIALGSASGGFVRETGNKRKFAEGAIVRSLGSIENGSHRENSVGRGHDERKLGKERMESNDRKLEKKREKSNEEKFGEEKSNDQKLEEEKKSINRKFGEERDESIDRKLVKDSERTRKRLREMKINREVGALHEVVLSHLVSPDEFYVFVKCPELNLMEEMKRELKIVGGREGNGSGANGKRTVARSFGSLAMTFSENFGWKRVKVVDWRFKEEEDDLIRVFYVDHGSSGLVSFRDILPLTKTLADYPAFAQKCYLSFIAPIESDWSDEDKTVFELFTESTEKRSHLRIEITEADSCREDGGIGVRLYLPESGICVNDKLVEHGAAAKKLEESRGRYLPAYSVGDRIPAKVTCIARVNHIFCVKDFAKTNEPDDLEKLIGCLNDPKREMSPLDESPSVGGYVVAMYEDGLWYRAQVVKSCENACRVIFIDYGNTETVSRREIRKMEERHLKIPFQMIECLVEDVELKMETDQEVAVNRLNELVAGDMTVTVREVIDASRSLYKVTISDGNGTDIAGKLVSEGYAVWSRKKC